MSSTSKVSLPQKYWPNQQWLLVEKQPCTRVLMQTVSCVLAVRSLPAIYVQDPPALTCQHSVLHSTHPTLSACLIIVKQFVLIVLVQLCCPNISSTWYVASSCAMSTLISCPLTSFVVCISWACSSSASIIFWWYQSSVHCSVHLVISEICTLENSKFWLLLSANH